MGKGFKLPDLPPPANTGIGSMVGGNVQAAHAAEIERLTKLVHILWKQMERLQRRVQVIPEGLRIKTGVSEVLVLKNGGIILDGQRILLKTPGKQIGLPV